MAINDNAIVLITYIPKCRLIANDEIKMNQNVRRYKKFLNCGQHKTACCGKLRAKGGEFQTLLKLSINSVQMHILVVNVLCSI